ELGAGPAAQPCATGGTPKRPGGPGGYWPFPFEQIRGLLVEDADPTVWEQAQRAVEPEPCGTPASLPALAIADALFTSTITSPVLLVYATDSRGFQPGTPARDAPRYSGSSEVTVLRVPKSGHVIPLELSAPTFR